MVDTTRAMGTLFLFLFCLLLAYGKPREAVAKDRRTIPYSLPFVKSTVAFVFDGFHFLHDAIPRFPYASTLRISVIRDDIYLVQGPKNVAEVLHDARTTVNRAYGLVLKQCFGMRQKSVDAYLSDTSGSRQRPLLGSSPSPGDRISFMTHENLVSGLMKTGLEQTTDRFVTYLAQSLQASCHGHGWTDFPDLAEYFENHQGSSLIRALFGPELLAQHPTFAQDLWEFDKGVMGLARRLPRVWIPQVHRVRDALVAAVGRWHSVTVNGVRADAASTTEMMRERHRLLLGATGQNAASVASTDLAFIWASVTNVVPSSMTLALHIFGSHQHLSSLRGALSRMSRLPTVQDVESLPLLHSMYAETLRLGVQIHIPRNAPYHDVHVGGMTIPRDKLMLVNTRLAHMDERVWNTRSGERPLDQFWAERFLLDPSDERSGPTKKRAEPKASTGSGGAQFTTEGLEGAWIPFGGGQHACPGRLLAKRVMLLTSALLVGNFDIEVLADDRALAFGNARFGFGVSKPAGPVPFRIRQRSRVAVAEPRSLD